MSTKDFDGFDENIEQDDVFEEESIDPEYDIFEDETGSEDDDFRDDAESGDDVFEVEDIDPEDDDGFDDEPDPEDDEFDDEQDIMADEADTGNDADEYTDSDFDEEDAVMMESGDIIKKYDPDDYTDEDFEDIDEKYDDEDEKPAKKSSGLVWKIGLGFLALVIIFAIWTVGTKSGRRFGISLIAKFVHSNVATEVDDPEYVPITGDPDEITPTQEAGNSQGSNEPQITNSAGEVVQIRSEDYVKTYLLFGIEEIDGAANTDAILLVSVNSKDNTIKMTSILRDTYVTIPGYYPNKINSVYARGARGASTVSEAHKNGAELLVKSIEENFRIDISGWACVNFKRFENIVDRLGGIDIELGEAEAKYLNKTNYISNPEYRNVSPGWNHLNGNQVVGYCRVRKEETLGGANNDYGRTVRHRRVINAIVKKYTSSGITELLPILKDCLAYVYTDLSEDELTDVMATIVENKIYTTKSLRIPIDGTFKDSGKKGIDNGYTNVTWTLVMGDKVEDNIKKLYEFVFLDDENAGAGNGAQ